jgi:hypothetical protein
MFIPGPKLTKVFASRWNALWWAAGILLTAYCSVPPADKADPVASQTSGSSASPWAKSSTPAAAAP